MSNISIFVGRFNPLHRGHLNTIKYLSDESSKHDAEAYIGMTNTSDTTDNPLKFKQKLKYLELALKPFKNVHAYDKPVYTIYEFIRDMCFECEKNNGGVVRFYAGSDRVESYKKLADSLIKKYQGRNELTKVSIEVVEAMVRGSSESYSATKMRQHVKDGDLKEFIAHCPFPTDEENKKYGKEMFDDIKKVFGGDTMTHHNITSAKDTYEVVKQMSQQISQHENEITHKPDKLYVVGGSVRDEILGKPVNDFDLITTMEYRQFAQMFDADDVRFRGKNIIVVPVIDGEPFETACLTREMSLEDRLYASDLTMNGMAKDVETDEIIDPCKGQQDIKKKVINLTDFMKDAMPKGKQPVAVMRCIRFACVFGWQMTPDTKETLMAFSKKTKGKLKITDAQFSKDWGKIEKAHATEAAISYFKEFGLYDDLKKSFGTKIKESRKINVPSFLQFVEG